MKRNDLPETAVIGLLWTCIMNAVEWNKKEELVAEQALKHLKVKEPIVSLESMKELGVGGIHVIPAPGRLKQEDHRFTSSLGS